MFRRLVVFTLLPMLLLTRGTAVGHAHGMGGDSSRPTPHIHIGPLVCPSTHEKKESPVPRSGHHHGHKHRHDHHHHHHDDTANSIALPPAEPLQSHDDDVIEIVVDDAVIESVRNRFDESHKTLSEWMSAMTTSAGAIGAEHSPSVCRGHPPPNLALGRCPLHLLHLVLVI